MQEEGKPRRGNQGWSTAGRAGRKPLPPGEKRKNRSLKATDWEWEKILEFSRRLKDETKMEKKNMYGEEIYNTVLLVFWDDEAEGDDKDFGNYDGIRKKANRYGWTLREIPKSDVVKLVGMENFTTENIVPIALSIYWALSEGKGAGYCTFDNML